MKLNKKNIVKKYPLTQNIFVLLDKISRLRRKGEKNTYFCVKKFGYLKKKYYLCNRVRLPQTQTDHHAVIKVLGASALPIANAPLVYAGDPS